MHPQMRRISTHKVAADNRDKGKVFVMEELSATRTERWAMRALLAMMKSGVYIPDDIASAGMAGIAVLGIRALAGIPYQEALALMDEMFACVKIMPDPTNPAIVRELIEDDIQEVSTRLKLRDEVFKLHAGFSLADVPSTWASAAGTSGSSSSTRTSLAPSPPSSPPG